MYGCLFLVSFGCCKVEVFAAGCSLIRRNTTESGVSECDLETSVVREPRAVQP